MSRKAQGLSLNTIIIAAIVLIVLLVLVGLLTGYFGNKWKPGFDTLVSTNCKGQTVDESAGCASGYRQDYGAQVAAGKVCCIPTSSVSSSCKEGTCIPDTCSMYNSDCKPVDNDNCCPAVG